MKKYTLVKGKIWQGESDIDFCEAFLVHGDSILAVGNEKEVFAAIPSNSDVEVIDACNNLVMPGMTDAHTHLLSYAKLSLYVNMQYCTSFEEAMLLLQKRVSELPKGSWIRGVNYNEVPWKIEQITKKDLDRYFPENPILISRYCGHVHVINTAAAKYCGISDTISQDIPRDRDGSILGILNEGAGAPLLDLIASIYETDNKIKQLLKDTLQSLSSVGITSIHDCDAPTYALGTDLRILQEIEADGDLSVRIITYHDAMPNYNFTSGFGNEMLMYGGFKMFTDGSVGGRTAALTSSYTDDPLTFGVLNHTDEEFFALIVEAHKRKMQVQIHAIGDAAINQVIRVLEQVVSKYGKPALRYRLNHGTLTTPEMVEKLKNLDVAFDIQPSQAYRNRYMMPIRLGKERSKNSFCFRRFWETGQPLNSSSDIPIETVNPWDGIWTLCTRSNLDGTSLACYDHNEIIPLAEAMKTYTLNPWRTIGLEHIHGKIKAGYKADFTLLDCDPFNITPYELKNVKHTVTYCSGKKVWSAN